MGAISAWRAAMYVIAALAIVAAFGYTYHLGYSRAEVAWQAKYEHREAAIAKQTAAELSRQAQANAQAKVIENKRLDDIAKANAELEKQIKEKADEADADPDRGNVCLSDGSRLRIDSVH